MVTKRNLMDGPKKQFNLRMPLTLHREIEILAKVRGMKRTQVALAFLEEAAVNKCRRCHWGLAPGSTKLRPKPCRYCFGTGRLDHARMHRKLSEKQ